MKQTVKSVKKNKTEKHEKLNHSAIFITCTRLLFLILGKFGKYMVNLKRKENI